MVTAVGLILVSVVGIGVEDCGSLDRQIALTGDEVPGMARDSRPIDQQSIGLCETSVVLRYHASMPIEHLTKT